MLTAICFIVLALIIAYKIVLVVYGLSPRLRTRLDVPRQTRLVIQQAPLPARESYVSPVRRSR